MSNNLYKLLGWIIGLLVLLIGIVSIFSDPIIGILFILIAALILPGVTSFIKQKWNVSLSRMTRTITGVVLVVIFGIAVSARSTSPIAIVSNDSPQPQPAVATQNTTDTAISPDELPMVISLYMVNNSTTTGSDAPALTIQREWNQELGYSESLSPDEYTPLNDPQVKMILSAVQQLRKEHSDKWFDVMIFDDPTVAQEAQNPELANLPDSQYCKIFAHFRGTYSWNPTNQYEQMAIGKNCNWQSLLPASTSTQ